MKQYKFKAFCKTEENAKKFTYEILKDLKENPNNFEILIKKTNLSFEIIAKEKQKS